MLTSSIANTTTTKNYSNLKEKINVLTNRSIPYYRNLLLDMLSMNLNGAEVLVAFLEMEKNEYNVKQSTITNHIHTLYQFSRFADFKDFDRIVKEDIIGFLNSVRKSERDDPNHKWVNTYNNRRMVLSKFFRWFYNKDEYDKEKWVTPSCMQGTKQLKRKEKSGYKPSDIWTNEEHSLFLKYCPEKRDRCYHAMANDTSCRPHELLSLRIDDVKFKMSSNGSQYAEVHISDSKTKPRTIPLIFSVPYVKEWIDSHPQANNPKAFLFCALSDRNYGERLSVIGLNGVYQMKYKQKYFPELIKDHAIPERDKAYIRNLLTKPFNPYIIRHSSLTQKSQILKKSLLRDHAGWTATSNMPNVYIHYFGNESSKSLLEAYGIEDFSKEQTHLLKAKQCPNCNEPNKPESKFCFKCRMVLTYDAYSETLEEQKKKEDKIEQLRKEHEESIKILKEDMDNKFTTIIEMIQQNPKISNLKSDVLIEKIGTKIRI